MTTPLITRANALALPLANDSVDLIVTSPPYFGLRSYQDGGEHYSGQIGDEPTPAEFVDALIAATAEMVRVVKPSGSIWVNLGDKYAGGRSGPQGVTGQRSDRAQAVTYSTNAQTFTTDVRHKSLIGIPWRYAIRCIDDLGLILRANVIWSKPNGLPESVTDRVRRSHEDWFHFTLNPRYYSAVDEIREASGTRKGEMTWAERKAACEPSRRGEQGANDATVNGMASNPLGKLSGSVWIIPTEPLHVPDHLGIDHFAAFPTEWPRRIIQGWSPRGICVECGEGRRPVLESVRTFDGEPVGPGAGAIFGAEKTQTRNKGVGNWRFGTERNVSGEVCACPEPTAPTQPGVVLDPFGGTGTTALVAHALGRHGISNDMSNDYCRLATWRTNDPKQQAKAARRPFTPPPAQIDGQTTLDLLLGNGTDS